MSLSDFANSLKLRSVCLCSSEVGFLGVGAKLRPFVSTCTSCGVSWNVLRLCTSVSPKEGGCVVCGHWGVAGGEVSDGGFCFFRLVAPLRSHTLGRLRFFDFVAGGELKVLVVEGFR